MTETEIPWYADHANLVLLVNWMAESGDYEAKDIAYAVEKPHKFTDEFKAAKAAVEQ